MKPAPFFAAFAGLGFVTTSPVPTVPQPPSEHHKVLLLWDPPDAYKFHPTRKSHWGQTCDEVLFRAGCSVGIIHASLTSDGKTKTGKKIAYVNVEGGEFMENWRKMRVFNDGSSQDGWSVRDLRRMEDKKKRKGTGPASEGQNAVLVWNPPSAYKAHAHRRSHWEEKCQQALTREGCGFGIIHAGEHNLTEPNGEKGYYVNVEAAPSPGMEPTRKMRVFHNGRSEDVADRTPEAEHQRGPRRQAKTSRQKGQEGRKGALLGPSGALLFWDPENAYKTQPKKKSLWEQRCDEALTREGCWVGIIHQGERRGQKSTYVNVEGAPSLGQYLEDSKQMRVFEDASTQHGWSSWDRAMMAAAKRPRRPQSVTVQDMNHATAMDLLEASAGTQDDSKPAVAWNPPRAYDKNPWLRKSYEEACHKALATEGCDFGIVQHGYRSLKNPDGTTEKYMHAFAGTYNDPQKSKYMRLFEDGTSEWLPLGTLPGKDGKRKRPMNGQEEEEGSSTHAQRASEPPRKRPNTQVSTGIPAPGTSASTRAAYPGLFQGPGGGDYHQYSVTGAPTQEHAQENSHSHWSLVYGPGLNAGTSWEQT